jgi:hypothetical protein
MSLEDIIGLLGEVQLDEQIEQPRAVFSGKLSVVMRLIAEYVELVRAFVALHAGVKQHTPAWYASMATTVGGSELAAVMGQNHYSSFVDVALSKVRLLNGIDSWEGGEACWWGTLFEDVLGAYVALDLGAEIFGDTICVFEFPGHRNSPDGYAVVRLYRGTDGKLHLWTTDMNPGIPVIVLIALLEFKCPMTRKPSGGVPIYYRPQLQSGLAVSPVAHFALFAEAVFRKCSLADLGDTPDYDAAYHTRDDVTTSRDINPAIRHPLAWGLIFVYAPRLGAPRGVRLGWRGADWAAGDPLGEDPDPDGAVAAADLHARYFGFRESDATADPADLGDMCPKQFVRTLRLIDSRRFPVVRGPPRFADGRGAPLHAARAVAAARAAAPPHHWLLGVLPWKLFSVDYHAAYRQPGFMDEVLPLITELHSIAAAAQHDADPEASIRLARGIVAEHGRSKAMDADAIQSLFDSCSLGDAAPPSAAVRAEAAAIAALA